MNLSLARGLVYLNPPEHLNRSQCIGAQCILTDAGSFLIVLGKGTLKPDAVCQRIVTVSATGAAVSEYQAWLGFLYWLATAA